ncbi:MAG: cation-efflux pump [Clostridiales bacterium]|nr:MAG: cation-efflux pump [Clostridiales bacterium]
MIKLLLRIFVKDYKNTSSPQVRAKYGVLSGAVGIVLNLFLFAGKLAAGVLTASISIVADAFNNLSDAGSSIVTLIGFKLSNTPADKEHPFGHGRVEYITGLVVSFAIILVGIELLKSSFGKIFNPEAMTFDILSFIIIIAAILVKVWMFFYNSFLARQISSPAIKATAMDSLTDTIATFAVAAGMLINLIWGLNLDAYIGLLVAGFIIFTGIKTAKESLSPLLGNPPNCEFVEQIKKTVMSHEYVTGIHDLIIHDYGPSRTIISLHAEIPADIDIIKAHDTIDLIEMELRHEYNCDVTIHMDPLAVDDDKTNAVHQSICDIVKSIDENLTIHDFRMVEGSTHTNLIFDVTVPHRFKMADAELAAQIRQKLSEISSNYYAVMRIERGYL